MRRSYQTGSIKRSSNGRYWLGHWREEGPEGERIQRVKILGKFREISKSEARAEMAKIIQPINERNNFVPQSDVTVKDFVEKTYLPMFKRKWKASTYATGSDRVKSNIVAAFGDREMRSLEREGLQAFLDSKKGTSFSNADHLRWDLNQMFKVAIAEGIVSRNPATLLFTPRECPKPTRAIMTLGQVRMVFDALELRERLIMKLAILAGMRPGEIFALRRGQMDEHGANIRERIYRGIVDTPKTEKSIRMAALSVSLRLDLEAWLKVCPGDGPDSWLFPSEKLTTAMWKDNVMYRFIRPRLENIGLGWVDFHVTRRTHSSLMEGLGVDPKVIADQQGHTLDVHMNVYTETSMASRAEAVAVLDSALIN